jgi:outer membrane protein assembly factor BamB
MMRRGRRGRRWRWARLGSALLPACVPAGNLGPAEPPIATPVAVARGTDRAAAEGDAPPTASPEPRDPPRLLTDPGSGVFVVWAGAAAAATVAGAELVVLEPDLRHLSAYDWLDGEPRWRTELPVSAAVQLYGLDDRVVLHDGGRVTVVEAARGRVMGRHPAPVSGRWPYVQGVEQRGTACAWVGPCGIRAFDCDDGSPRGDYLASEEIHLYGGSDDPSEHGTECTPSPRLLGRHDDTIVLVAHLPARAEPTGATKAGPALVAVHAGTGATQWHHPLRDGSEPAGVTHDGACWVLERQDLRLRVLDSDTGVIRWEREIGPGMLEAHAFEDGIVVSREHGGRWRLSAYRMTDGKALWSTRLARRVHPLFPGGPIPNAQSTMARRVYALVDPLEGRVMGELAVGRDETLWRDPSGGLVLIGRDLREVDATGRIARQRPFSSPDVHTVTTTHVLGHDGDAIEIFDREQLRERARLEGRLVIDTTARLPDDRLLLQRSGDDGVALMLGLVPPSRGGRRD